jgi:hypothetical protein
VNQWEKMTEKNLTLRTLHYFAKLDNEEMYKEFNDWSYINSITVEKLQKLYHHLSE